MPIRTRLTDEEVAKFAVNRYRFPGVDIRARLFRQYPMNEIASHVIGYIGRINERDADRIDDEGLSANYKGTDHIGKTGLEQSYEDELHGSTGYEQVEVDSAGRGVRTLSRTSPTPGNNLVLTLDIKLQEVAEQAFGDDRGALVAIDPATGGILAFVSKPGFDPNLFVDGIDPASWDALNNSPDRPMVDRALAGTYPPGSTFKPYMALAALQLGKRTPQFTINDPGYFQFGGHRFHDDKPGGHGVVDMYKSLVVSCDTYYYMLANDMGIDNIARFIGQFGFGAKTGIDIEGEATGVLPSPEWKRKRFSKPEQQKWYAGETISIGIGQGYNAYTPLQLAQAMATLANNGVMYRPHLVDYIENIRSRRAHADRTKTRAHHSVEAGEHRVHQTRAGRREYRGHGRARLRRRRIHQRRQDRHGASRGVKAERKIRREARNRAPPRSRAVRRFRAAGKPQNRARGSGGECRFRRGRRGADRAPGAGLLPSRQEGRPACRRGTGRRRR